MKKNYSQEKERVTKKENIDGDEDGGDDMEDGAISSFLVMERELRAERRWKRESVCMHESRHLLCHIHFAPNTHVVCIRPMMKALLMLL